MSYEDDDEPEDAIAEIFREAQGSESAFGTWAAMLSKKTGSMYVTGRPFRERLRRVKSATRKPRAARQKFCPEGFGGRAASCLLCGLFPQEYGSCRCAGCNQQRARKRSFKSRAQRAQESSP